MELKLNLSNTEHKELVSYCNLNDLLISQVVKDCFTTGFNIERYGLLNSNSETKEIIKEVVVEKRVEVPVEIIKEVVKIEYVEVEKPIEKVIEREVIKEVPIETIVEKEVLKEVFVEKQSDNDLQPKLEALQNTVQKLKQDNIEKDKKIKEYEKTIQDIQKFQEEKKAMFLRGSNLDDNLYK